MAKSEEKKSVHELISEGIDLAEVAFNDASLMEGGFTEYHDEDKRALHRM